MELESEFRACMILQNSQVLVVLNTSFTLFSPELKFLKGIAFESEIPFSIQECFTIDCFVPKGESEDFVIACKADMTESVDKLMQLKRYMRSVNRHGVTTWLFTCKIGVNQHSEFGQARYESGG